MHAPNRAYISAVTSPFTGSSAAPQTAQSAPGERSDSQTVTSTIFGASMICAIGAGTDIGTITGALSGWAKMDINAVVNYGFLAPSAKWEGSYRFTSPTGLGVSAWMSGRSRKGKERKGKLH
jgi:hypothetical protein